MMIWWEEEEEEEKKMYSMIQILFWKEMEEYEMSNVEYMLSKRCKIAELLLVNLCYWKF